MFSSKFEIRISGMDVIHESEYIRRRDRGYVSFVQDLCEQLESNPSVDLWVKGVGFDWDDHEKSNPITYWYHLNVARKGKSAAFVTTIEDIDEKNVERMADEAASYGMRTCGEFFTAESVQNLILYLHNWVNWR